MDGFFLSAGQGFQAKDFPKLCAAKNLKGIAAATPGEVDWRLATERQDLLFLELEYVAAEIDLSSQPQLESVSLLWNEKVHLPPAGAALRRLMLRGYAPKTEDFSELVGYSNLEYLSSTQGKLRSVNGASRLAKLNTVCLYYERRLASVAQLAETNVECLILDHCPKIGDVERLAECRRLKEFGYNSCAMLQSLSFLRGIETLEVFTFVGTKLIDGDLSALFRLRRAGFDNKRHFSHSSAEVVAKQKSQLQR